MTTIQPPQPPAPATAAAPSAPVDGTPVDATATSLPPSLQSTARDVTLKGEVVGQNADGTTRIATPRGPVDVQLPAGQTPARGTVVEMVIPAGSPPRGVSVTLPQTTPQNPSAPTQPPATPTPPLPVVQTQQTAGQPATQSTGQGATPTPSHIPPTLPPATVLPAAPAPADTSMLTPQGLLAFLKSTLNAAMAPQQNAAPNAPPAVPSSAPQAPAQILAQHPLPAGQTLRLTPFAGPLFTMAALPANTAAIPAQLTAINAAPALTLPQAGQTALSVAPLAATPALTALQMPSSGMSATISAPSSLTGAPLLSVSGTAASLPAMQIPMQTGLPAGHVGPLSVPPVPATFQPVLQALDVRVTGLLPAVQGGIPANAALANLVHGTPATPAVFAPVIGATAQGLPVVELPTFTTLPDGTQKPAPTQMVLQFPARGLAMTALVRLDMVAMPQATLAASPLQTAGLAATLDDALQTLRALPDAQGPLDGLQAALPKPGAAAFTAPVLMLASAMRSGEISQWLGDKTLEGIKTARRADILTRLGEGMAHAQNAANGDDGPAAARADWRAMTLPMLHGGQVTPVMLHVRGFEREDANAPDGKLSGTRFVMDVSLSRMGPLQIDGFSLDKRLDVTLRSERNLSPAMREIMRTLYAQTVADIGFAGQLNFASDRKGWVDFDTPRAGADART